MLTGRRAFGGKTVPDILAAVARGKPDWKALPTSTPWQIRRLLGRCLQQDPALRVHDIAARPRLHLPAPSLTGWVLALDRRCRHCLASQGSVV